MSGPSITVRRALPVEVEPTSKRTKTRTRLKEAALRVFAERGIPAASVSEIAEAADVANGTFYLYFQNKAEIVATVCHGVTRAMHEEMSGELLTIDDGAARIVFGTQQFIEIAADEPVWGRLLLSAFVERESIRADVSRFMRADVRRGIAQGRFSEIADEFLMDCLLDLLRTGLEARLAGAGPAVSIRTGEYMLRLLGLSPADSRQVSTEVATTLHRADEGAASAAD